ncbi:MAG: DUF4105 domain-containing protein [Spirochaetaceae bacterium]|jgi:hypothetical protein|nr:DUF4105 domain-containing protein [Spirochaetaceae bacterium]
MLRAAGGAVMFLLGVAGFMAGTGAVFAQTPRDYAATTVKMAVYGPSDEIFIWWGHAALIVEEANGAAFTYDWGIFDYPGDDFLAAFLQDKVRYRSAKSYTQFDIKPYFDEDRDIVVYTLDLDDAGKENIIRYAEENVLPENCWYAYDDFTDNCSTRIRDLIDMGTGGQLRARAESEKGRFTLRQHVRRFMMFHPWIDWYTGFLMGRTLDRTITAWDEMFLPVELGRYMRDFSYTGPDGQTRSLVTHTALLNQSKNRQPVLNAPPGGLARSFCAGLFVALLFALIIRAGAKNPAVSRAASGILQSAAGLFLGLSGLAMLLAPVFAGNEYLAHNNNLLFINPLFLAAVPLGIIAARKRGGSVRKAEKALRVLWAYLFCAALAALLLNALPSLRQENQSAVVFVLPVALAFMTAGGKRGLFRKSAPRRDLRV